MLYGPPPATLQLLLDDPAEHDFPCAERLLSGLTPQQAVEVPPGLSHSIAGILAHMHANVVFNLGLVQSEDPPSFRPPGDAWPSVSAREWPPLVQAFLADMARLGQIAQDAQELERRLYPATSTEPGWTVGYKLAASVAKHNAYHFGQIALIRRLLGAWE
ncbi:DinB family protein [Deinococcus frigens]